MVVVPADVTVYWMQPPGLTSTDVAPASSFDLAPSSESEVGRSFPQEPVSVSPMDAGVAGAGVVMGGPAKVVVTGVDISSLGVLSAHPESTTTLANNINAAAQIHFPLIRTLL